MCNVYKMLRKERREFIINMLSRTKSEREGRSEINVNQIIQLDWIVIFQAFAQNMRHSTTATEVYTIYVKIKQVVMRVCGRGLFPIHSSNQAGNPYGCSEAIKLSVAWHFWCSQSSASMRLMFIEKYFVFVLCVNVYQMWTLLHTHTQTQNLLPQIWICFIFVVIVWHVGYNDKTIVYGCIFSVLFLFLNNIFKNECSIFNRNYFVAMGNVSFSFRDFKDWSSLLIVYLIDFESIVVNCSSPWRGLAWLWPNKI